MALLIEDYALLSNTRTAALVGRDGSIDWFCPPRFDANACFAALLGDRSHGRWLIAPKHRVRRIRRRYRDQTLILETEFHTAEGSVCVIDFMPLWSGRTDIIRIVEGLRGRVAMTMELIMRFGYGRVIPWVRRVEGALQATAGPDSLELRADVLRTNVIVPAIGQVAGFTDLGWVGSRAAAVAGLPYTGPVASAGVGLRWIPIPFARAVGRLDVAVGMVPERRVDISLGGQHFF